MMSTWSIERSPAQAGTPSRRNGAELTVSTCCTAGGSDIDLFLYGPDGSLIASSSTATDEEFVTLRFPAGGTYTSVVLLGPPQAPGLIEVPVEVTVQSGDGHGQ